TILAESLPGAVATTLLTLEAMRVLVIAADPTEKRVLALQVEQWGAAATSATPEEALGAIQMGRPFDIALIEHRPPAIDGLEISASLRGLRRPDQMPIVLIGSATSGAAEAAAADSGLIQATLTKPVPPRTLHDVMIQVAGPGDQNRCLRAGFDDDMSKPVRREDLTEALKAAVGYRSNRERAGL